VCFGARILSIFLFVSNVQSTRDLFQEVVSQDPCQLGDGAALSITALLLYFCAGVFLMCSPKPEPMTKNRNIDRSSSRSNSQDELQSPHTAELKIQNRFDPEWA